MNTEGRILRERYELIAEIGRGGFSTVWLARDINLGAYWAVKQVKNTSNVEFNSFLKEVELLSSLNHPNIPRIVDRIEEGDDYFVVMDFIDGTALSKIVNLEGPQNEKKVISWAILICDTMAYLHSNAPEAGKRPIVYRDLKPDNIMLCPSGAVKIIDFGTATAYVPGQRLSGESLGTRGYAAPEQYRAAGNALGEYSDIYSLGATMYFLSTGFVPGVPPNGVPSVRSKNPDLSDAFEFCVAKCTADDPANRYQSFAELKAALESIEKLSESYRKKQKMRLVAFYSSLVLSIVFAAVGWAGYRWLQADLGQQFREAYQTAATYDRQQDYLNAARYYATAIAAKPDDRDTHILLFNALLPHGGGEGARAATMSAIDEMRKSYLDNRSSPMHNDPLLCYMVVRRCIEVEDTDYAELALHYISVIRDSSEYADGAVDVRSVHAFEVIASFQTQNTEDIDFDQFNQTLEALQEYADTGNLSADEKLHNYYLLIRMLSTYPRDLPDSYQRAQELGIKARDLLNANIGNENLAFNNIVPLYELMAVGQCNGASFYAGDAEREQAFRNSIEWFGYLENLHVEMTQMLELKRANAYKGVFDTYNTPARRERMSAEVEEYLHHAITLYENIIQKDEEAFLAYVYLTHACYDREMLRPPEERDFTATMDLYTRAKRLISMDSSVPSTSVMQFGALTKLLQNAGLGV